MGIGCGGTAISIPMSVVGKHFPLSNRTIAMSIVTAVGSFGYFFVSNIHKLFIGKQWLGRHFIYFYYSFMLWIYNSLFLSDHQI